MSDNNSESIEELAKKNVLRPKVVLDAMQNRVDGLPTQQRADLATRWLKDTLAADPVTGNPVRSLVHLIDQSSKEKPPTEPSLTPNPALTNAHGFNTGDTISIDPDGLLDFARKLEDKANEIEEGVATRRAKVEAAFQREARMYTKDARTAPVFQPLGKALAVALDKVEANVSGLTATLRNDARLLRELVDKHEEAERRAVRGFDSVEARPRG
ncbi:hypothetical protein MSTE_02012 [Mycobacteroides stephanolepidis]|uniref:Uncharacterized protein n=1 Tax=[Mycobacterium] stephanolepidis TaxID=1520670 RepID=A0A1Z4EWI9_9MYCO|nr:hypothetical protein [[Mycobacterium] stephanolepidis]BAX97328.1 hypothetical protein MSTE_02012 [[Mycobacterium] stephanolepidis]